MPWSRNEHVNWQFLVEMNRQDYGDIFGVGMGGFARR